MTLIIEISEGVWQSFGTVQHCLSAVLREGSFMDCVLVTLNVTSSTTSSSVIVLLYFLHWDSVLLPHLFLLAVLLDGELVLYRLRAGLYTVWKANQYLILLWNFTVFEIWKHNFIHLLLWFNIEFLPIETDINWHWYKSDVWIHWWMLVRISCNLNWYRARHIETRYNGCRLFTNWKSGMQVI